MPKTAVEAATLIGVAAALIAGWFYALGTVAQLSYFSGLGFDAHQFPTLGSELQVSGFVYGALPGLSLLVVALAYACLFAIVNRVEPALSHWLNRAPAKLRIPIGLIGLVIILVIVVVWAVLNPPGTLTQLITSFIVIGISMGIIALAVIMIGEWVFPVALYCFLGVVMLLLAIAVVGGQAYKLGQAQAAEAGNNHATTTIIEFTDGHRIPAPGARVVCSERFCGFNDGKTATVMSLEDVRTIQSPVPQEPPAQPDAPGAAGGEK